MVCRARRSAGRRWSSLLRTQSKKMEKDEGNCDRETRKGPKSGGKSYRPISLLSTCYKLLGRLVLHRVSPEVDKLLSPEQAGFRRNRSTCEQVAALTTHIENGFQRQLKTGAVFLDLTAAYDTVWHTGLLCKLCKNIVFTIHRSQWNHNARARCCGDSCQTGAVVSVAEWWQASR